jgi:mevalonate kinase
VLRGAKALAVPLNKGQSIEIAESDNDGHPHLLWFAFGPEKLWFKTSFELPSLDIIGTDDRKRSAKLQLILLTLKQLNPSIFDGKYSYNIKTRLDFKPEWGFGSSSTLIANLSRWARVDPYTLLNLSIGGSGYDIACALSDKPLFYQLKSMRPNVQSVEFMPSFHEKLFLVYRGNKQDSGNEILRFNQLSKDIDMETAVQKVSEITDQIALTHTFSGFCDLMDTHESLVADLLQHPPLKTNFPDFQGHIKSLGAWGGDFFLAMSNLSHPEVADYFASKGLQTLFKYKELIF